jgi:hypothetical protein
MAPAQPRLLYAANLASGESLLRETRATALFYFPGPVLWLIVLLFFDYSTLSIGRSWVPPVPGLTSAFGSLPTVGSSGPMTYLLELFLILTLVVLLWLLVRYLLWTRTVYAVTTSRVIIQRGIFSRDFNEIPILQIRGADVHQTFLQRLLGYGTIVVSSEGGGRGGLGNETWRGIPRPFEFQRLIEAATQALSRNIAGGPGPAFAPAGTRLVRPPGQS